MKKHKNTKKSAIRVIAMATAILILFCMLAMFTGCAEQVDSGEDKSTTRAIIFLPDGEKIEGAVDSCYFSHSDTINVTIEGVKYVTHSSNVVLIYE